MWLINFVFITLRLWLQNFHFLWGILSVSGSMLMLVLSSCMGICSPNFGKDENETSHSSCSVWVKSMTCQVVQVQTTQCYQVSFSSSSSVNLTTQYFALHTVIHWSPRIICNLWLTSVAATFLTVWKKKRLHLAFCSNKYIRLFLYPLTVNSLNFHLHL